MVRYRRNFLHGGTYFFTATLRDRHATILIDQIALLREAFRHTREKQPFDVEAIVVLPDHLHAVWTLPPNDADYSGRWRAIKARFTRGVAALDENLLPNRQGEYDLWQRRFWEHTIRDDADFARCVDYIHFNPVKHGLVASPAEWRHSSLHRYLRQGILPHDWGGDGVADSGGFGEPLGDP